MDFKIGDRVVMTTKTIAGCFEPGTAFKNLIGTVVAANDIPPRAFVEWEQFGKSGITSKAISHDPDTLELADPVRIRTNNNLKRVF